MGIPFLENPDRRLTCPDVIDIFLIGIQEMGSGERIMTGVSALSGENLFSGMVAPGNRLRMEPNLAKEFPP